MAEGNKLQIKHRKDAEEFVSCLKAVPLPTYAAPPYFREEDNKCSVCVGGKFLLYMWMLRGQSQAILGTLIQQDWEKLAKTSMRRIRFPPSGILAEDLLCTNSRLKIADALRFAIRLTKANDARDFDKAYEALTDALSFGLE